MKTEQTSQAAAVPECVITIGRSFGAGGRQIGRIIADKLGVGYYDKELLADAASRAGMDTAIFEKKDERAPGFLAGFGPLSMGYNPVSWYTGPGSVSGEAVYGAQSDFIRDIASRGPCVIVGRTADYILRRHPRLVSVFLHAPEEECIERIISRQDTLDRNKARNLLRKTNKLRAEFYNFYTDRTWGDASTYHLSIDSSSLAPEAIADMVIEYIKRRFS